MTVSTPAALTRFVGRGEELAAVRSLLRSHPLVTLVGMGGIGKTRLASEVALRLAPEEVGEVAFVSLTCLPDTCSRDQLYAHLALSLEVPHTEPSLRVLRDHLIKNATLIVLDNCEHVPAVHAVLVALLQLSPQLRVLATSRSAIGIDGERVVKVRALSQPSQSTRRALAQSEAVQMLTEQVEAAVGHDLIGATDPALVVKLCRHLRGHPLWIRLAAARLKVLTIDELLVQLQDPLRGLAAGSAATRRDPELARHASAYTVIATSYALCSNEEQLLWARLSIFAGSFDLQDAQSVCGGDGVDGADVLDLISGLVDQSILERVSDVGASGRTRYTMLYELRAFGRRMLEESGQLAAVRCAHRRYHQQLLEQAAREWFGPREVEILTLVNDKMPDIIPAIQDAVRDGDVATARRMGAALVNTNAPFYGGYLGPTAQVLDEILAADRSSEVIEPEQALDQVMVIACSAWVALCQGHQDKASALLGECERRAQVLAGSAPEGPVSQLLAGTVKFGRGCHALLVLGDRAAVEELAQAREALQSAGAPAAGAAAMATLLWAMACGLVGDPEQAVAAASECRRGAERAQARWMITWSLWAEALAYLVNDDAPMAARRVRRSLKDQRAMPDSWGRVWNLELSAWVFSALGRSGNSPLRAARAAAWLLAACEGLQRRIGVRLAGLEPFARKHDAARAHTLAVLSSATFAEASEAGAVATIDDAVLFVLDRDAVEPRTMGLTLREATVARLAQTGLSSKDIAQRLYISPRTVDQHLGNAMKKLGVSNRSEITL